MQSFRLAAFTKVVLGTIISTLLCLGSFSANAGLMRFDIDGPSKVKNIDPEFDNRVTETFTVAETGKIKRIGVRLKIKNHWDNIFVSLEHLGTEVILMNLETDGFFGEGETAKLKARFKDGGAELTCCSEQVTKGKFKPIDPLSNFKGMNLAGDWTFTFYDTTEYAGDGSKLLKSSIYGKVMVSEPSTLGLLGIALAGLVLIRRQRQAV